MKAQELETAGQDIWNQDPGRNEGFLLLSFGHFHMPKFQPRLVSTHNGQDFPSQLTQSIPIPTHCPEALFPDNSKLIIDTSCYAIWTDYFEIRGFRALCVRISGHRDTHTAKLPQKFVNTVYLEFRVQVLCFASRICTCLKQHKFYNGL